ncbi:FUSC family protein [Pseudonocardia sp. GCM10023141]|uniref:FUSC family protein n=1 Tax=Pseudonocardia sp. GCM10023141 TaxID=3252653 RepID=UPI00360E04EB
MTVAQRATAGLRRRDPDLTVVRRAVRVTVAATVGFAVCRYGIGDATAALYALFGAIAMGVLSDVSGTPAARTRTYLAALLAGLVLVTIGTLLAVDTVAASVGMLVVGFAVAYAGIGGPRPAGIANGLQLFYVLPCFPPYAPDTLDARLIGLALGVGLLALADRVMLPPPTPADVVPRIARSAAAAAGYAHALQGALLAGAAPDGASLGALRADAHDVAAQLRLAAVPTPMRPSGPGLHDRSLTAAATAVRLLTARLGSYADLLGAPDVAPASAEAAAVVGAVAEALERVAAVLEAGVLEGGTASLDTADLDTAFDRYLERRGQRLAGGIGPPPRLMAALAVAAITESTRTLVLAVRGAEGQPPPAAAATPAGLWFLHATTAGLWRRRLRVHLTVRSVYLQNAMRLALGLAAARAVAGAFDLSHGFWVLLATLSLMRTSAVASRSALVPAFAGTVVGAAVAGGVLTLLGTDVPVYAALAPLLMVVAFAAGPLFGVAAGQAGFTVVVAVIFAQVAPATWRLAETRLLDVVVGGLVGALIGAAVWPRGGRGEVRRVAAAALHAAAAEIGATAAFLTGPDAPGPPAPELGRLADLFDHTYAQYRSEPAGPGADPDWLVLVGVVRRVVTDSAVLRAEHPQADALPWPELADRVRAAAVVLAGAFRSAAVAVSGGVVPDGAAAGARAAIAAQRLSGEFAAAPEEALRAFDVWAWLFSLVTDLENVERALVSR